MNKSYVFYTEDNSVDPVTVLRGDAPPKVTGGYGGWEVVKRARRTSMTDYSGADPLTMTVPIMFDGFRKGISQEAAINRLSKMALPSGERKQPPAVTVSGGLPLDGKIWLITDIAWGDNQEWKSVGTDAVRIRQDAVVTVMQKVDPDVLVGVRKGASRGASSGSSPRMYTVKKGDTLFSIAVKFYHDRNKWKLIANANHIRDPKKVKVGRKIKIP